MAYNTSSIKTEDSTLKNEIKQQSENGPPPLERAEHSRNTSKKRQITDLSSNDGDRVSIDDHTRELTRRTLQKHLDVQNVYELQNRLGSSFFDHYNKRFVCDANNTLTRQKIHDRLVYNSSTKIENLTKKILDVTCTCSICQQTKNGYVRALVSENTKRKELTETIAEETKATMLLYDGIQDGKKRCEELVTEKAKQVAHDSVIAYKQSLDYFLNTN